MNFPEAKSRLSSVVILPDNLIEEILSFLNVKSLMQFKCVCKSWNTLITSDRIFIELHLKRSARNGHLALIYDEFNIIRLPLTTLIHQNTSITTTLAENPYFHEPCFRDSFFHQPDAPYHPYWSFLRVVGSCNGLLCLYGYVNVTNYDENDYQEIFLYLWNPATKTLSGKIVFIHDKIKKPRLDGRWKFWFGYDNSTKNYKIVAYSLDMNKVRVLNLGDNVWRHIHSFPVVPLDNLFSEPHSHQGINNPGVYVSGAVNWLAIPDVSIIYDYEFKSEVININEFVIISLDLRTETYRQFLPPIRDQVISVEPTLTVLMDSLCFFHDFNGTHFMIWQMKEFGFEESWTQFLKISYKSIPHYEPALFPLHLFPLCLSNDGDTLIMVCEEDHSAILYNLRYDRGEKIRSNKNIIQWFCANYYVESLVTTS